MLWGERVRRRRVLVGLLVAFMLMDAGLALVVHGGPEAPADAALPLHPVATDFRPDDTRLTDCADEGCFQQAFGNVAYSNGPTTALELLDDIYGNGEDPACHRTTHVIGAAALARFGGNVTKTLSEGRPTCWSGYYHGVVERALVKVKSRRPAALAAAARPLCSDSGATPWVVYGCLHGLGHGLMIATGLQLPLALEVCSRLERWWDRDACWGGAFMENISSSYGFRSIFLKDDDPVYPCTWVAYEMKSRCYLIVTSRILPLVGDDWTRTAEICAGVEHDFVGSCFQSFGRDASSRSGRDPSRIAELCSIARRFGGEDDCVRAAAYDITGNFVSGRRGAAFCAAVHSGVRGACYYGVGTVLARLRLTDPERRADCVALAGEPFLAAECVRGGRENLPRA